MVRVGRWHLRAASSSAHWLPGPPLAINPRGWLNDVRPMVYLGSCFSGLSLNPIVEGCPSSTRQVECEGKGIS